MGTGRVEKSVSPLYCFFMHQMDKQDLTMSVEESGHNANNSVRSTYRPPFDEAEYARRVQSLRRVMAEADCTAGIFASAAAIFYFTGYCSWSFYTPQFLVVLPPADERTHGLVLVVRSMDAPGASAMTHLSDQSIVAYDDTFVDSEHKHPITIALDVVFAVADQRCCNSEGALRCAVDMDCHQWRGTYTTWCERAAYQRSHADRATTPVALVDLTRRINNLRAVKSEAELCSIRAAGAAADRAFAAALAEIRTGSTGDRVAARVCAEQTRGGQLSAIPPLVMVNESCAHTTWNDALLREGDVVRLEIAGTCGWYNCPISRTVVVGDPRTSDAASRALRRTQRTHAVFESALYAAVTAATVGSSTTDVVQAYNLSLRRDGVRAKRGRLGYSFGIGFAPDWGENAFSLIKDGPAVRLLHGMCIHLIAGCGDGDSTVGLSEAIMVTVDGPRRLCASPRRVYCADGSGVPEFQRVCMPSTTCASPSHGRSAETTTANEGDVYADADVTPLHVVETESWVGCGARAFVKDESRRLGSSSFKILGVRHAAWQLLKQGALRAGDEVVTMTDGNHGVSLAQVARDLSLRAKIFVPDGVCQTQLERMRCAGASVVKCEPSTTYEQSARLASRYAEEHGAVLFTDHSWEGNVTIPRLISEGYQTLFVEAARQVKAATQQSHPPHGVEPTHVFVQTGVGGLLSAAIEWATRSARASEGRNVPCVVSVEPARAACVFESVRHGELRACEGAVDSCMTGLNCDVPSLLAWERLRSYSNLQAVTICEESACAAVNYMRYALGTSSAESGAAGVAAWHEVNCRETDREALGITADSVVLLINTEADVTSPALSRFSSSL